MRTWIKPLLSLRLFALTKVNIVSKKRQPQKKSALREFIETIVLALVPCGIHSYLHCPGIQDSVSLHGSYIANWGPPVS